MRKLIMIILAESILVVLLLAMIIQPQIIDKKRFSHDKQYCAYMLTSKNGDTTLYTIVEGNSMYNKIYSTELFYTGLFHNIRLYWGKTNYDFFLLSSDFGIDLYKYQDGQWSNNYLIELREDIKGNYYVEILHIPIIDSIEIREKYDIKNIPEPVLKNIMKWYEYKKKND